MNVALLIEIELPAVATLKRKLAEGQYVRDTFNYSTL